MTRKSIAQQIKGDIRNSMDIHHQSMDLVRRTQALSREVRMILAPKLDFAFLYHGLIVMPRLGIVYVFQRIVGSRPAEPITKEALCHLAMFYGLVFEHIAEWIGFWTGMLFRWLLDELGNAIRCGVFMLLMALGYLFGGCLVLALIYFVLTH